MPEQLKPGAFRVFDTEAKEYKDPDEYWMNGRGALKILYYGDVEPDVPGAADAGPRWIAERWTGRKNLYEGDVVSWSAILHEVVWFNGGFALKLLGEDTNICCEIFGLDDSELPDAIGTIHDSPEALAAAAKAVSQ